MLIVATCNSTKQVVCISMGKGQFWYGGTLCQSVTDSVRQTVVATSSPTDVPPVMVSCFFLPPTSLSEQFQVSSVGAGIHLAIHSQIHKKLVFLLHAFYLSTQFALTFSLCIVTIFTKRKFPPIHTVIHVVQLRFSSKNQKYYLKMDNAQQFCFNFKIFHQSHKIIANIKQKRCQNKS